MGYSAVLECAHFGEDNTAARKVPGTALVNSATKEIVYTPPENQTLLRDLLANWERYIHSACSPKSKSPKKSSLFIQSSSSY
jgi:hypothetical protein